MANRVLMPKGSDTMTEGKVLKWLKKEGDPVSSGDALLEIETDKVNMEVEAVGSGVLRKVLVPEGSVVPVGELLAVVAAPNEDISAVLNPPAAAKAPAITAASQEEPAPPPPPTPQPAAQQVAVGGRILASPIARRLASEAGLDLSRVAGSGPAGRIIRSDVERAARELHATRTAAPFGTAAAGAAVQPAQEALPTLAVPAHPIAPAGPEFKDEPLSSMRKTIATRLTQSLGPVPHFFLTIEVDMRRAKELRESANLLNPDLKLSYNDIILKACAAALEKHGEVNASFQGDKIRYYNRVHIGMAVATDDGGLITPVIRDANRKNLQQIAQETKELAARARSRRLLPEEYSGSTFSVSNLGMMGIDEFTAVINPPEGAILAVGAVVEKPVVVDGRVEVGTRCRMTMSCDHRVVDGATGARFLLTLRQILENPVYLAF
ncbi:MAG TPA: dihydrolipoamide acetyltransferase family protein [Terriglobia bacterium]|jgi:pyruvate dehydrogenase E2 component (dihydrolipoamide acetyltransferase)|nr:dihydrolipoamide acetyltransferase family protein [Terriglobia bacterium]